MTFERKSGESMDNMIIWFEATHRRANREGGMVLNAVAFTYLLIQVVGVKTDESFVLLNDFNGDLPSTETEYRRFLELLRRPLQGKKRSSEGKAPEYTEEEHWDENEVWQYDAEQTWYKQGTNEQHYKKKQLTGTKKKKHTLRRNKSENNNGAR
eukprot:4124994-Amphidinium_carterae.1